MTQMFLRFKRHMCLHVKWSLVNLILTVITQHQLQEIFNAGNMPHWWIELCVKVFKTILTIRLQKKRHESSRMTYLFLTWLYSCFVTAQCHSCPCWVAQIRDRTMVEFSVWFHGSTRWTRICIKSRFRVSISVFNNRSIQLPLAQQSFVSIIICWHFISCCLAHHTKKLHNIYTMLNEAVLSPLWLFLVQTFGWFAYLSDAFFLI